MRALRKVDPDGGLVLTELPQPVPGPGELLVRVRVSGLCGTDLSIVRWADYVRPFVVLPRTLGHELVGVVEAVGPETSIPVGTRVTADSDGGCGVCRWCQRGLRNACERQSRIGTQRDGALADLVIVPERSIHPIPDAVSDRAACLLEPFGAAMRAVERLTLAPGGSAAVIGPGPVGLLAAVALEESGYEPVLMVGLDKDTARLDVARGLGFEAVVTARAAERAALLGPLDGVDVVVDAVGSADSLVLAIEMARFGGQIAVVGLGQGGTVDPSRVVAKELTVVGSWRRLPTTWDRTLAILSRRADLEALVDGLYALDRHEEALAAVAAGAHIKTALLINP